MIPLLLAEVVVAVCGIATAMVSARLLGLVDYGVAGIVMSAPQLVYSLVEAQGARLRSSTWRAIGMRGASTALDP